jgi:hypothetical protein
MLKHRGAVNPNHGAPNDMAADCAQRRGQAGISAILGYAGWWDLRLGTRDWRLRSREPG